MSRLLTHAKAGGVTSSELAHLRDLAKAARHDSRFDAGAKAQLNQFLGHSADASHASGRLPPAAQLPQQLGFLDSSRMLALDQHFKRDDGMIGRSEMGAIIRNVFSDGNLSAAERSYLSSKLTDPNVSDAARGDIERVLGLRPGERLVGDTAVKLPALPERTKGWISNDFMRIEMGKSTGVAPERPRLTHGQEQFDYNRAAPPTGGLGRFCDMLANALEFAQRLPRVVR
ncbi:MAG: hypothetical protein SFW67_20200 [Myxococcaceae bacterium]|nr:hypothetical protein [Myxococcaceae bacterium]